MYNNTIITFVLSFLMTGLLTTSLLTMIGSNPTYAWLYLVLIFINIAGTLIIFNFEFIALLLIIIYVGALAVLFLFILMMVDINLVSTFKTDWFVFLIFSCLLSFLIFLQFFESTYRFLIITVYELTLPIDLWINYISDINNCATLGHVLYSYYYFFLLIAGLVLLLALLGTVHLIHVSAIPTISDFKQISKKSYFSIIV